MFAAGMSLTPVQAATCGPIKAESGAKTIPLVELYTSEGCNSCPPADKWFRTLDVARVTPLAFHVDYWDYIGWKDRFADSRFGDRQTESVRRQNSRVRYTPQVMLDGEDTRRWSWQPLFESALGKPAGRVPRARIGVTAEILPGAVEAGIEVAIPLAEDRVQARVLAAVIESGLSSAVRAGENRGETLHHDHVVRAWAAPQLFAAHASAGAWRTHQRLSLPAGVNPSRAALVIAVEDARTGITLQSLRIPFCG
jgi:hypothetical protein